MFSFFRFFRLVCQQGEYNISFPADNTKLAEMEFYLVNDLECDLVVFHPYRTLMTLVTDSCRSGTDMEREAGELGAGLTDAKYWGTGEAKLVLQTGGIQMAWCVESGAKLVFLPLTFRHC